MTSESTIETLKERGWRDRSLTVRSRELNFFVPGTPAPQGSKSFKGFAGNGRAIMIESSKAVGPWRERVALAAHNAMRETGWAPFDGALSVRLAFVLPRPKSAPKTIHVPAIKRPDGDKLLRAVLDAMTGIVYRDDAQIVDYRLTKDLEWPHMIPNAVPGCHITVSEGKL